MNDYTYEEYEREQERKRRLYIRENRTFEQYERDFKEGLEDEHIVRAYSRVFRGTGTSTGCRD